MNTASGNSQHIRVESFGYATKGATAVLSAPAGQSLLMHSYSLTNASLSTIDMGLGVGLPGIAWKFYSIGATTIDVTASIQGSNNTTLVGTTNNYGAIIQCKRRFGYLIMNVSQIQTGSPAYSYEYWNGTAWTTLTLNQSPVYTATGLVYVTFQAPSDWTAGNDGTISNFNGVFAGFCIRIRGTTAPTQTVLINSLTVAKWIAYRQSVGTKQCMQVMFKERPYFLEALETLIPYFGAASASNSVEVSYQTSP